MGSEMCIRDSMDIYQFSQIPKNSHLSKARDLLATTLYLSDVAITQGNDIGFGFPKLGTVSQKTGVERCGFTDLGY